jgi:hypothetical protein
VSAAGHTALPPRRLALALLAAGALALTTAAVLGRPDGRTHLTVLDAGAGSAVLVETSGGQRILIGAGGDPTRLAAAVGRGLPPVGATLDLLVLPGSSRALLAAATALPGHTAVTEAVALTTATASEAAMLDSLAASGTAVHSAAEVTLGGVRLTPIRSPAASPAILLRAGPVTALLLEDLSAPDQEELAAMAPAQLRACLVVAPPAGGVAISLLAAARPQAIAVPGSGRMPIAWPGARTSRTAADGDLSFVSEGATFEAAPP